MIELFLPRFSKLKERDKREIRERSYSDILIETVCSMFEYKCPTKKMTKEWNLRMEYFLRFFGKVGICKNDEGEIVFGECHWAGGKGPNYLDYLGFGKEVIIVTLNGKVYRKKYNVDCAVIFNNMLGHSELNIMRFVQQLSEVDLSQVDLLYNARMHPIIVCKDEVTRIAIQNALNDKKLGTTATVLDSAGIESQLLGDNRESVQVVTITDPQTAELFQYYSHYHLDLMSRIYGLYGLSTFNTGKMAQTNNLEVSGTLASSMSIPMMNLKWRLKGLEEVKEYLGADISVEFTECWKHQELLMRTDELNTSGQKGASLEVHDSEIKNEEETLDENNTEGEDNNSTIRENRIRRIEQTGH